MAKKFIVVNIEKGLTTPYYYVNEGTRTAYVRKGDQSIIAPVHELNNMILSGSSKTFDALQSQFFITKGSFTLFEANCEIEDGEVIDRNKNLISFGLALPNGYLTNAGALLADKGLLRQPERSALFFFCRSGKNYKNLVDLAQRIVQNRTNDCSI